MADFGLTLKELRKKSGLTQQQLADRMMLSKASVSYYEQSLRYPSAEVLVKIAKAFHVTTDYLLGLETKSQKIDVQGLSDEDILYVTNTVEMLRRKTIQTEIKEPQKSRPTKQKDK